MGSDKENDDLVAPNVWRIRDVMVNLYLVKSSIEDSWVLIDTGMGTAKSRIKETANKLFGNKPPVAIFLTHGHFDHVGSVKSLGKEWNVPIYAHTLEAPYLTDKSDYPPPDPSVNDGLFADLAFLYPKGPIDISDRLQLYPSDGSLPFLTDWRYIHTPGHAPGHVSFFRDQDKVLIAGDAIVTTKQESVLSVLSQKKELSSPPKYFTYDWKASEESVKKLAQLNPSVLATGHGQPLSGEKMQENLQRLAANFKELGLPKQGRYLNEPAIVNELGVKYVPPRKDHVALVVTLLFILLIAVIIWIL